MKDLLKIVIGFVGFFSLLLASLHTAEFAIRAEGVTSGMMWLSATIVMIAAFAAMKISIEAAKKMDKEAEYSF